MSRAMIADSPEHFPPSELAPDEIGVGVSFLGEFDIPTDLRDDIFKLAGKCDTGATLLMQVLELTGQVKPLHEVAKHRSDTDENASVLPFSSPGLTTDISKEEQDMRASPTESVMKTKRDVEQWELTDAKVHQAYEYYKKYFQYEPPSDLCNLLSDTYEYNGCSLQSLMISVRKNMVLYRKFGQRIPKLTDNNVTEAVRLLNLLALEEDGKISFADN